MNKLKWHIITAALMPFLLMISGCGGRSEAAVAVLDDANRKKAVIVAEPQTAVDEIYASLKEYKANPLTSFRLKENVGIAESDLKEYYGKISEPEEGLADVMIIRPKEAMREDVRLALSKYKEQRMAQFENYDILDAYSIAQNAVIYDQGDYIIFLMLVDNDAARAIIDEYIPL